MLARQKAARTILLTSFSILRASPFHFSRTSPAGIFRAQSSSPPSYHSTPQHIRPENNINKGQSILANMGWDDTWSDILSGGNPRWKVDDAASHERALSHFQRFVPSLAPDTTASAPPSVFCPLAGDDPFVPLLWSKGYSVTAIDLVPAAVDAMRAKFGGTDKDWTREEHGQGNGRAVVWTHCSGRATLLVGDALSRRPDLERSFDAVYDKDSFGAIGAEMRKGFCSRIADFLRPGAVIYLECKLKDNHEQVNDVGPPYSLTRKELMDDGCFGADFEYVEGLGPVYNIHIPNMQQTGHIMRRKLVK